MTTRILAAILLLHATASALAAQGIQGRWKLLAGEDLNADGSVGRYPWGRQPVGSIVVQDGGCYVQIMSSDVPEFPRGDASTVAQMSQTLFSNYISYTGPCTVDEDAGSVTLKVEAAWRPDYAVDQTRYFRIVGDTLLFGPTVRVRTDPPWDASAIPAGTFTRRLKLVRAAGR
ncbi:MAG: lipocalin-like domain-containing protein [Gemmatimonadetes bacterium]|nr:lipocalin-like domain-containing protein [Gemmatimonadota bacterium]